MGLSGKNSARFSRISANFWVFNFMAGEVSDGEMVWVKCTFSRSPGWNSDPENSPSFPLDRATYPAPLSFASH
jgi:hypothetical protein